MQDLTPSHTFGSSSFIDGYLNVIHRLSSFVDEFEQQVVDYVNAAIEEEESSLKKAAASKWGQDISDGLSVEYQNGGFVYKAEDEVAADVANFEFGARPTPVIRPQAIRASKHLSTKLSNDLSKVVPSA